MIFDSVSFFDLAAYEDLELLGDRTRIQEGLTTKEAVAYADTLKRKTTLKLGTLPNNTRINLLKRRRSILVDPKGKGWVNVTDVLPAYLFAPKSKDYYDTIYNPHRKISHQLELGTTRIRQ